MFRRSSRPQIQNRIVSNVSRKQEKAHPDYSQRPCFVSFATFYIRVNGHPPQQDRSGRNFDEAIQAKPNERNAPSNRTRSDSYQALDAIPYDCEILKPSSTTHGSGTA